MRIFPVGQSLTKIINFGWCCWLHNRFCPSCSCHLVSDITMAPIVNIYHQFPFSWGLALFQSTTPPAMPTQESWVRSLGWEDTLEEGGHGNPLQYSRPENPMDRGAWQLQSMGSQRIGQDWSYWAWYSVLVSNNTASSRMQSRSPLFSISTSSSLVSVTRVSEDIYTFSTQWGHSVSNLKNICLMLFIRCIVFQNMNIHIYIYFTFVDFFC